MIKIEFKPDDIRKIKSALQRMILAAKTAEANLAYIGAVDYRNKLWSDIANQTMPNKSSYPDYRPQYKYEKLRTVGHLRFWEYSGDLIANLRVFKAAGNWVSGLMPSATGSTGLNITEYAVKNETVRGRPLFVPVAKEYAATGWKKRGQEALDSISKEWR